MHHAREVHELGHGYAMKRCGVQAGWPIFIPFFGAMISMKGLPQDRSAEAQIAYGGPLAGTAAALLAAAMLLASILPAQRAARLDPNAVLRQE